MRRFGWAVALALCTCVIACSAKTPTPLSAFDGRVEDWTRELLADSPEAATRTGSPVDVVGRAYGSALDDRSALAQETRRTDALRRLAELRAVDTQGLDGDHALTLAVVRAHFEAAAQAADVEYGAFDPLTGARPYALDPLDSAFVTLPAFLDQRHPIRTWADVDAYQARLHAAARAIDGETERARRDGEQHAAPPGFIIDETLAELDAQSAAAPVSQPYVASLGPKLEALVPAAASDAAARTRAQARAAAALGQAAQTTRDEIMPALQRAAAALRAMRAGASDDPGVWRLPQGGDLYVALLRLETSIALTAPQIHHIGLDRVRELQSQLDIALRRAGLADGPINARLAQLNADPRYRYAQADQALSDIRTRVADATQRAPQWFAHVPHAALDVQPASIFAPALAPEGAYAPPSFDGVTHGVYTVDLRGLASITKADLPTQDFANAIPGRHFQIALAQEQTRLPLLRRLLTFAAFEDGWAAYAEQLADEQGLYESDPAGRVGYLRAQLRAAAALVVDTGVHAGRWSRQQAIDYFVQTAGDSPATAAAEVDRIAIRPGRACAAEIGRREFVGLRERARTELGPDFDLRAFHDAVLLNGELPLGLLDRQITGWIARRGHPAPTH